MNREKSNSTALTFASGEILSGKEKKIRKKKKKKSKTETKLVKTKVGQLHRGAVMSINKSQLI